MSKHTEDILQEMLMESKLCGFHHKELKKRKQECILCYLEALIISKIKNERFWRKTK